MMVVVVAASGAQHTEVCRILVMQKPNTAELSTIFVGFDSYGSSMKIM